MLGVKVWRRVVGVDDRTVIEGSSSTTRRTRWWRRCARGGSGCAAVGAAGGARRAMTRARGADGGGLGELRSFLEADAPRVNCPEHGPTVIQVPRAPGRRGVRQGAPAATGAGQVADLTGGKHRDDRPVTIDLAALAQLREHEAEMLARYLRTIEVQRGDYNGRMLTIRRQDLTAIACIFGCPPRMRCPASSTTWASALSPDPAPHSTPSHRRALTSSTQREPHWSRPPGKRAIRIKATLR